MQNKKYMMIYTKIHFVKHILVKLFKLATYNSTEEVKSLIFILTVV